MGFTNSIKMSAMKTAFGYIEKNPEENLLKLLGWVDKLAGDGPDSFPAQRAAFRSVLENSDSNMYRLIMLADPGKGKAAVQLQYSLGHPAGPHLGLQPALYRLLGRGIWQQAEPDL